VGKGKWKGGHSRDTREVGRRSEGKGGMGREEDGLGEGEGMLLEEGGMRGECLGMR